MHGLILGISENGFQHRNAGFLKNGIAVSFRRTDGTRRPDYSVRVDMLVAALVHMKKDLLTSFWPMVLDLRWKGSGIRLPRSWR